MDNNALQVLPGVCKFLLYHVVQHLCYILTIIKDTLKFQCLHFRVVTHLLGVFSYQMFFSNLCLSIPHTLCGC